MKEFRIIVALLLILFSSYIVVMNWWCVIMSQRNKRKGIDKHHSTVPLVSFILAALAYAIFPFATKGWIGIIPVVDIGNWMLLIGLPVAIIQRAFKKKPPNKSFERAS